MQKHGAAENLNLSTPAFALTVVDLSKVKHLPLYGLATPAAPILHNAPVTVVFAIFDTRVALQKHFSQRLYSLLFYCEEPWSVPQLLGSTGSFI